jgi:hypothetical protein
MRLEFTYTVDDLLEAQAAQSYRPGSAGWRRVRLAALLLLIAAAFVLQVFAQLQPPPPRLPRGRAVRPLSEVVPTVLPWVVFFGVIGSSVMAPMLRQMRGRKEGSVLFPADHETRSASTRDYAALTPPRPWPLFAVLGSVGASILLGAYVGFKNRVDHGRPGFTMDLFQSLFPLGMLVVILVFLLRSTGRAAVERALRESKEIQLPQAVGVGEETISVANATSRGEHRWEAFERVVESPNLFMLFPTGTTYIALPKRAFPSPHQVTQFRELVRRMIVDRPGSAFPVLPLNPTGDPR